MMQASVAQESQETTVDAATLLSAAGVEPSPGENKSAIVGGGGALGPAVVAEQWRLANPPETRAWRGWNAGMLWKAMGLLPRIMVNIVLIVVLLLLVFLMWAPGYVGETGRSQGWMRRPGRTPPPVSPRSHLPETNEIVQSWIPSFQVR